MNLTENDCFGKTDFSNLGQEENDKALPILKFMILKRNELLKTRWCANGIVHILYTSKEEVSLLTPGLYAIKFICAVIIREGHDIATIDLPGFLIKPIKTSWYCWK